MKSKSLGYRKGASVRVRRLLHLIFLHAVLFPDPKPKPCQKSKPRPGT